MPIGWVQPTSGRKLQVAMPGPVDPGYRPIMHLAGYRPVRCWVDVEVFEAAVRLLPYALPFEYVLVGSMRYDTLVERVGKGVSALSFCWYMFYIARLAFYGFYNNVNQTFVLKNLH